MEENMYARHRRIGRVTREGIVEVDVRLEWKAATDGHMYETVDHDKVDGYWEFAVMGSMWKSTRSVDCYTAGQCIDSIAQLRTPLARRLVKMWREWHLNGAKAGCVHVEPVLAPAGRNRMEVDCRLTPSCPVSGYRYGSAWLVRVIPDDVLTEMRQLITDINAAHNTALEGR